MTDLKGLTPRAPRVLYWTELFWPEIGGVEVLSVALVPALRERGWELAVVTSHGHGQAGLPERMRFGVCPCIASRSGRPWPEGTWTGCGTRAGGWRR